KKLVLQRGDRNVETVAGFIDTVERRAAIEEIAATFHLPRTGCGESVENRHQRSCAFHHGRIDDLPFARSIALEKRGEDAECKIKRATAIVADQVERRQRCTVFRADRVQSAGERNVVEVVARSLRKRTVLAKSGHASVHEPTVAFEADIRPQAEPLGNPGTKTFDQHVCFLDETQHHAERLRALQIQCNRTTVARADVELGCHANAESARFKAIDAHDIRTKVGKQHRAHRAGADAGEFDDTQAGQRAHCSSFLVANQPVIPRSAAVPSEAEGGISAYRYAEIPRFARNDSDVIAHRGDPFVSAANFSATISRSCRFRILPTGLTGNSFMISRRSGSLNDAIRWLRRNATNSSNPSAAPGFRITHAQAFSPNTGSGIATSTTDFTAGCAKMRFSTSSQLIFSPPRLIWSLRRPSVYTYRPRLRTMSPIRYQPPGKKASAFFSAAL